MTEALHRLQAALLFIVILLLYLFEALLFFFLTNAVWQAWQGSYPAYAWCLVELASIALCSWCAYRCLLRRRFLHAFGTWRDLSEELKDLPEAYLAGKTAQKAFEAGDYSKCQQWLGNALVAAPGRSSLVLNLSSVMAWQGNFERSRQLLNQIPATAARARLARRLQRWAKSNPLKPFFIWLPLALVAVFVLPILGWQLKQSASFYRQWMEGFSSKGFQVQETEHYVFYYHDSGFLKLVQGIAAKALPYDLQFYGLQGSGYPGNKIKIYLCSSQQEYLERSPFTRSWEAGSSIPTLGSVYLYWWPNMEHDPEVFSVLAHELSHLCYFRMFPSIPEDNWLNEGLATYLGRRFEFEEIDAPFRPWMQKEVFSGLKRQHLPFQVLLSSTPLSLAGNDSQIDLFYTQGFSVVFMLVEYYGPELFLQFMKRYAASGNLEKSLAETYPKIGSINDLEGNWLLYMAS